MVVRLPAGARKIKEILDNKNKTPEQKLDEIEQVVNDKLQPKVRNLSGVRDKLRPETVKISQEFYQKLREIINRTRKKQNKNLL